MREAWTTMRRPEAPMIQNMVARGEAYHKRGIPITKRPVYRDFWVTT
jgi:hypothetical protein